MCRSGYLQHCGTDLQMHDGRSAPGPAWSWAASRWAWWTPPGWLATYSAVLERFVGGARG